MALLSHEMDIGIPVPTFPEIQAPIVSPEITLNQGEQVPLGKPRLLADEVGSIDWADFAERSTPTPGFADYQEAGGTFSEGLYQKVMKEVVNLQKPDVRENSTFSTGTIFQIEGFERSHNKPFLGKELPPEEQNFLSQPQKDAYYLLREKIVISEKDRQTKAYYSDALMIEQVRKMPGLESSASLESYGLFIQKQERLQTLAAAA